jgi:hypothetical protein
MSCPFKGDSQDLVGAPWDVIK